MIDMLGISMLQTGVFVMIVVVFYVIILGFVLFDLSAGIRKAKAAGVYRSSYGLRETFKKLANYYNVVVMFTLVDIAIVFASSCLKIGWLPIFPFLTFACSVGTGYIEIKSVFEKYEEKERAKAHDAVKAFQRLAKDKDSLAMLESFVTAAKAHEAELKNKETNNANN